jgi:UV DNA damage endonuclease
MAAFRLGYVAHCLSRGLTASHTCRLATATPARLNALTAQNLAELERILLFNEAEGIQVFRIGSALVPLASHPVNRTRWWRTFGRDFAQLGRIASRSGQRLSLHPGPEAASLSSARASVRRAAVRELLYASRVLDLLGQELHGRVVLHVGGAAPDRPHALAQAHRFLDRLPDEARRRLAIEHDDRIWSAREVLPLAREHGLPFLADTLHNAVLPSTPVLPRAELLSTAARTWHALGLRPKHHVASQRRGGRPGAHARRISDAALRGVLDDLRDDADLMLEAKDKDLALLQLRAALARRGIVEGRLSPLAAPDGGAEGRPVRRTRGQSQRARAAGPRSRPGGPASGGAPAVPLSARQDSLPTSGARRP